MIVSHPLTKSTSSGALSKVEVCATLQRNGSGSPLYDAAAFSARRCTCVCQPSSPPALVFPMVLVSDMNRVDNRQDGILMHISPLSQRQLMLLHLDHF